MEIYDEETLPVRRIAAVGHSAADCIRRLIARGLDPEKYELQIMHGPR